MSAESLPRILILDAPLPLEEANRLAHEAGVDSLPSSKEAIDASLRGADAILTCRTPVNAAMIARAERCVAIVVLGPGRRLVDLETARHAGIYVGSVPDGASETWAGRAMELIEKVAPGEAINGSKRLRGVRLGIVGLGEIGRRVARRAMALGMDLLAHDPFCPKNNFDILGAREVPLDELLGISQVVTLHVPPGPETRGLIDARRIELLQRGSGLACCASPELIDILALQRGLRRERPAKAAFAWDAALPETIRLSREPGLSIDDRSLEPTEDEAREMLAKAFRIVRTTLAGGRPRHLLIDPPCPRIAAAAA